MYFSHQFETQKLITNGESLSLDHCSVDTDHFIRWFREKHRLCWKEIYLKLSSLMGIEGKTNAFKCTKCFKTFQISEMGTCRFKDDGSYSFHEIPTETDK